MDEIDARLLETMEHAAPMDDEMLTRLREILTTVGLERAHNLELRDELAERVGGILGSAHRGYLVGMGLEPNIEHADALTNGIFDTMPKLMEAIGVALEHAGPSIKIILDSVREA